LLIHRADVAQQTRVVQHAVEARVVDGDLLRQLLALLRRAG
jgi:hypothetical protein